MTHVSLSSFLALLVLAGACDDATSGGTNSNTNWLRVCDADEDCGDDWECLCGVCTASCTDSCEAAEGACVHGEALAHGFSCAAETTAVCLRACAREAECEDGQLCVSGACAPRPAASDCESLPDALFCSGFEADDLEAQAATWLDGGELARTEERALSGSAALAAMALEADGRSRARYDVAPQVSGMLYLRAWLYLDIEDASELHLHTLTVGSVDTAQHGADAHVLGGKLGFSFPNGGDIEGTARVPERSWFCMRMEIALGATDGSARIWLNDELSAEAAGVDTLPPDGVHNLSVGIDRSERAGVRLLVDDVALATSPLDCTP